SYLNNERQGDEMELVSTMLVMRKISLFESLTSEAIQVIAENVVKRDVSEGETLFNEGDIADGLYVLSQGEVVIKRADKTIASYQAPDFFGELALLDNAPRAGTAVALSDAQLFVLDKAAFNHITDEWPEILREIIRKVLSYYRSVE
ncbi:MAG: cyclic nucleotide-binding domain-containing protein, partial [Coxiellaceae bacterium]|nr:cyclic nucleotide-binding domain-containing protein [Coxiellaceae bacterium]